MSIVTLFTNDAPTLAGIEFDAVLEDTFESVVEFTDYPIESGASAVDHGIIQPYRWSLIGAVGNNPLRPVVTDFAGIAGTILARDSFAVSVLTGLSAGYLGGSDNTRGAAALDLLIQLQVRRLPFEVNAGDITLENMVIETLTRTKDPSNETGLIFEAGLRELNTLDRLFTNRQPRQSQLRDDDPAKSQIAAFIDKGEQNLKEIRQEIVNRVNEVLAL